MKALTLTSTLLAALSLSAFGQNDTSLRSQISLKEKELIELQKEIATLKSRLVSTDSKSYTVKTGDTVSSIARRYKVSAADLMSWNKITDPNKLGIGQVLTIKSSTVDVTEAPKAVRIVETKTPVKSSDYTIERGDTFYSIARRHNMTVTQLRDLNPDVSTHLITTGQTLKVSGAPVSSVAKAVKKETPAPVAAKAPEKKPVIAATKAPTPAPKKPETTTIATKTPSKPSAATTLAPKTEVPTPPKVVATTDKKDTPAPPTPPTPPVVKEKAPAAGSSIASIILENETTFDAFASKHGTNTEQLNALNGWNLPAATVLARGSEIYVPQ